VLERQLSRLYRVALRRAAGERSVPWAIIVVGAYLLRHALRDDEPVKRLKVRPGDDLNVAVRKQAG
jgi:hypothetical protein